MRRQLHVLLALMCSMEFLLKRCHAKKKQTDIESTEGVCLNSSCGLLKPLSNGGSIPLVGMGVGNLSLDLVSDTVETNLKQNFYRFIDTARNSRNEKNIAVAIGKAKIGDGEEDAIHIVTKVWYTYLGYDRTKISVEDSMMDLPGNLNIHLHILLHWPRCYDDIPWMDCEGEEKKLVDWVKDAGPPPHKNKDSAWKESWRALEDLYLEQKNIREGNPKKKKWKKPRIASIGVSNFKLQDMEELMKIARIKPAIYQGNLWSLLHDPYLMNILQENHVHFQAYNIMHGALHKKSDAPKAFSVLTKLASELDSRFENTQEQQITEAMVLMKWLVQEGVAVIPRASSPHHQIENSPLSISSVPNLTYDEKLKVKQAISALMKGKDLKVEAKFINQSSGSVSLHWKDHRTGNEVQVMEALKPGSSQIIDTHPGHQFVMYSNEDRERNQHYGVTAVYGESQNFKFGGEL